MTELEMALHTAEELTTRLGFEQPEVIEAWQRYDDLLAQQG